MKNEEVIEKFLKRQKAKNLNLQAKAEDDKFVLINYDTPIAYIQGKDLWINECKYSCTTSKIQGQLKFQASQSNYNIMAYNQGKIDKKGDR